MGSSSTVVQEALDFCGRLPKTLSHYSGSVGRWTRWSRRVESPTVIVYCNANEKLMSKCALPIASSSLSLSFSVFACISVTFASSTLANEPSEPRLADPKETLLAVEKAETIRKETLRIDQAGGVYPDEYVQNLVRFYKYGAGTSQEPGSSIVTRKFCREYSIALLWDLFFAGEMESYEPKDEQGLKNPLDVESERRLRGALTVFLVTARQDLTLRQRIRVYLLCANVLDRNDTAALIALRTLAEQAEIGSPEQAQIEGTIERITQRSPSYSE